MRNDMGKDMGKNEGKQLVTFCCSVLKAMRVKTQICKYPFLLEEWENDGIWHKVYDLSGNRQGFFQNLSESIGKVCESNPLFSCRDRFGCEYIFLRIPDRKMDEILIIGPFSYMTFSNNYVVELCQRLHVPESHLDYMQQYYYSLPVINDRHWMEGLIFTLAQELWGDTSMSMMYIEAPDAPFPSYVSSLEEPAKESLDYMEQKYGSEDTLMERISGGDLEKIEAVCQHLDLALIKQRFPNSLRDQKNNLLIFNTVCRKAAQYGGVHPIYLDTQSSKYIDRIEYAANLKELNKLYREIPYKYCLLVRSYSMKDYSPTIQKVIMYIRFNLLEDLSLRAIAEHFSLNKNYLSSSFKRETDISLTNYVNQERIRNAIYLLNTSTVPIQEIAEKCGIDDLNYFSRIFRQIVGMSPSSYRKSVHSSGE